MIDKSVSREIQSRIKVWKTITIGGKSNNELLVALEVAGFGVGDLALDMMVQTGFVTEAESRAVDIAVNTARDLGFRARVAIEDVLGRIVDLGGEICPPSLGPHLCLAYGDQPLDETLWMAMRPISGSSGLVVFEVSRITGRWLHGYGAAPCDKWVSPEDQVVFVLPRNAKAA